MKYFFYIFLLIHFTSCNSFSTFHKKKSMARYGNTTIERTLPSNNKKLKALDYIRTFNGLVLSTSESEKSSPPSVAFIPKKRAANSKITSMRVSSTNGKKFIGAGGAAPITKDGYFITVRHVLSKGVNWLITLEKPKVSSRKKTLPLSHVSEIRTVYSDEESDFAIIKVNLKKDLSEHLEIRTTPLEENELLLGGGWINLPGAGHYRHSALYGKSLNSAGQKYNNIISTVPLKKGDSGSPLLDQYGRVCGVNKGINYFFSLPGRSYSISTMLDPSEISRIIAQDRKRNTKTKTQSRLR